MNLKIILVFLALWDSGMCDDGCNNYRHAGPNCDRCASEYIQYNNYPSCRDIPNNNNVADMAGHERGFSGCLLGPTKILMDDYSTKRIDNLHVNDVILDGNLNKVTVVHIIKHYLSSTQLFQFQPDGPIFTADHQFLSNLETQNVGVVSKDVLLTLQPQMEEFSHMVYEFKNMENVLQFKNGTISPGLFEVAPFNKEMDPHTLIYALLTTGEDGTYVADNFVSRDVLPDVAMWPWTYGTLGMILNHCTIDFPSTLEGQNNVIALTSTLTDAWRVIIRNFGRGLKTHRSDTFTFDPLVQGQSAIQEILDNPKKIFFGQYIQTRASKLLHQTLDNKNLSKNQRFSLIKLLLEEARKYMLCNY